MKRKPAKRRPQTEDENQIAFRVVQESTGQIPKTKPPEKNPAAVALGRLGGLKGGPARAVKLGKKRLIESAKKAAAARWSKALKS